MNTPDHNNDSILLVFEAEYLPNHVLHLVVNGQPAVVARNFKYLHQGIAILRDTVKAEFPWVKNLAIHLDVDATPINDADKIVGGTTDPIIVCLAIRYMEALREGTLIVGPLPLPSLEEAHREMEAYDCGVILEPDATFTRS